MARWLLKTEPDAYSWDDLSRDGRTVWDGVTNALALKHLRTMKKNDAILFYHTGDERAVIGTAVAASSPYPDPNETDDKLAVVDVKVGRKLPRAVTLSEIKADKAFKGWDLLRLGRLSVVPVPEGLWARIKALAATGPSDTVAASNGAKKQSRRATASSSIDSTTIIPSKSKPGRTISRKSIGPSRAVKPSEANKRSKP